MTAAPELLDALERIIKISNGNIRDKTECIAKVAEIAIAKAIGGEG